MHRKSTVLLLSLALLTVSGSLFAADGQRGAWFTDEGQETQWTPRWMSEDITADEMRGPRGFAADQGQSAGTEIVSGVRMDRGPASPYRYDDAAAQRSTRGAVRSGSFTAGFSGPSSSKRAVSSRSESRTAGGFRNDATATFSAPRRGTGAAVQADDWCFRDGSARQYQNQNDRDSYRRDDVSHRRSMMR